MAEFCATQVGGCPTQSSRAGMCAWFERRGVSNPRFGGPIECDSGQHGYGVIEGEVERDYLFDGDTLVLVTEYSRTPDSFRCLASAGSAQPKACWDHIVAYKCVADAGID